MSFVWHPNPPLVTTDFCPAEIDHQDVAAPPVQFTFVVNFSNGQPCEVFNTWVENGGEIDRCVIYDLAEKYCQLSKISDAGKAASIEVHFNLSMHVKAQRPIHVWPAIRELADWYECYSEKQHRYQRPPTYVSTDLLVAMMLVHSLANAGHGPQSEELVAASEALRILEIAHGVIHDGAELFP